MTHSFIDLSSDTSTLPTPAMKQAMMEALLGDEQKNEDPTTRKLEEMTAELLGLEQAIFLPSATMANQIAIKVLCEPGDTLIAAENSHLLTAESGGFAVHSGAISRSIPTLTGVFSGDNLRAFYNKPKTIRHSNTTCISLENTTNLGGGIAWDLASLESVLSAAKELKLKTHLDGARLFNAAIKINVQPSVLTKGFDMVTICLSKGLGCPIGALLVLKKDYVKKALRMKHLFGGALRQSGILAAAGIYALQNHINRLQDDHRNADFLRDHLNAIPACKVENNPLSTNMVFFKWNGKNLSPTCFHQKCLEKGVRFSQVDENRFRAVMHLDIHTCHLEKIVSILNDTATKD